MSETYNISAIQGSTLLLNITCRDSAGIPLNLTNYNVRSYVRDKYSATGIALNLNPIIYSPATSGIVQISGNADDMANLKVHQYIYDVELSGANNYVFKPIRGIFSVEGEVTR